MLSIHERDFEPTDRTVVRNWEGDLIVGKQNRSAIGTLVERKTRTVKLLHLPSRDSRTPRAAVPERLGKLPPELHTSLTWDQGTEMASRLDITRHIGIKVYFCGPASPCQRGTNENTNGLLRQNFPKFTDLSIYSPEDLLRVENELNNRPRITLIDKTPAELFEPLLAFHNHPLLE